MPVSASMSQCHVWCYGTGGVGVGWGGDVHVLRTCTHELDFHVWCYGTGGVGVGWGGDVHVLRTCTHELDFHVWCYGTGGVGVGWGGDVHVLRTQMLDRIWHHVKKCIPRTLKNRDPQGYLNQKDLMQYVHRWQWRRSCDNDLFTSLGQACKKLRR